MIGAVEQPMEEEEDEEEEEEEEEEVLQMTPPENTSKEMPTKNKAKRKGKSKKKQLEGEIKCIFIFLHINPCTAIRRIARHAKPAVFTVPITLVHNNL